MPRKSLLLILAIVSIFSCSARAQKDSSELPDTPLPEAGRPVSLHDLPHNLLSDQGAIWSSPARLRDSNALGPALLVLATTVAITTDHQAMTSVVPQNASLNHEAVTASNGLVGGFLAAPVIVYGMGHIHHDDHAVETGILGGEAIADSVVVNEVLKFISMRERPTLDNSKGRFFQSSAATDSSFPSNHSVIAWSSAAVLASEYNGPMTQIAAYGLATGVSLTRVLGRQHFPSDVLVGSAVGWMVGRYVAHRHRRALE